MEGEFRHARGDASGMLLGLEEVGVAWDSGGHDFPFCIERTCAVLCGLVVHLQKAGSCNCYQLNTRQRLHLLLDRHYLATLIYA